MEIKDTRSIVAERGSAFIASSKESGVYILGTNKYGSIIKKWLASIDIPIHGFINDFRKEPFFENIAVFTSSEIPEGKYLINCVVEGRAVEANEKLLSLNPKQVTDYFSLQLAFPELIQQVDFLSDTDSILSNIDSYKSLHSQLADEESKQTLAQLLNFRLNRDINYLRPFRFRIDEQYFEPFIKLPENPSFVDGGGFDGTTSLLFAKLYPGYRTIYFFEPNEVIIPTAKANLAPLNHVRFYEKGLWNSTTTLQFNNTLSSASKLATDGNIAVPTTSIDEVISTRVDFIKLDIEGAESEAIIGAKRAITEHKPLLAICVYHAQNDFLRIPELIKNYRDDYKIYLRHYTQGVFETVMYFI